MLDGLDGLVDDWITHNEPWVTSFLGYAQGVKAPGLRDWAAGVRAAHHALLAHGVVVRDFRAAGRDGRIGITLDLTVARPATQSEQDVAAAQRLDGHHNRWFLDALLRGAYPADMLELYEREAGPLDAIRDGDLETIAQPLDFLGVNFYRPNLVAAGDSPVLGVREVEQDAERTAMDWPVVPEALTELLLRLKRDYGDLPLLITENGAAFQDRLDDGAVDDERRRRVPACAHRRGRAGAGGGSRRPRLLRLVAARQLRVGMGLRAAVRDRLRRLPDPAADPEAERALVPGPDRAKERRLRWRSSSSVTCARRSPAGRSRSRT